MKTKNLLTVLTVLFVGVNQLFATDRVVQHNGPVGTYANISAAITAAVDGDNIIINNRLDGLPWQENITINKSLTLVSAVDNVQWWMEGSVNVTIADSRVITIVGMKNTSAGINCSGTVPPNRTNLSVMFSDITGGITANNGGLNMYLGSSRVYGDVVFSYGKIIGNDLADLGCTDDVATADTNFVVGNRIGYISTLSSTPYTHGNSTQYLYFSNNFVYSPNSSTSLSISSLKSGPGTNKVSNCTLKAAVSSSGTYSNAFRCNHTSGILNVENNIICGSYTSASQYTNSISITCAPCVNATYNLYYNYSASTGSVLSSSLGNIAIVAGFGSNVNTNGVTSGTTHVNVGNPMNDYLDLDLTRNDIGCYGGSYSLTNFLPFMSNTESSRTNFVVTPRVVSLGGTVNVKAIGFDK